MNSRPITYTPSSPPADRARRIPGPLAAVLLAIIAGLVAGLVVWRPSPTLDALAVVVLLIVLPAGIGTVLRWGRTGER